MNRMTEKITLMEAYLIEHLRQASIADDTIKERVKAKEAASFAYVHDTFDFTLLHELADEIDAILDEGYEGRFLTFKALYSLLELKVTKEKDEDYDAEEFTMARLHETEAEITTYKLFVSANWEAESKEDGGTIAPVPVKYNS